MDRQDLQDDLQSNLQFGEITEKIIGCAFVHFRKSIVGEFFADLLVEGKVIVELKAAKAIAPEHQAQTINYLKATGIEVGLQINFGNPKLEYKRFT